MDWGEQADSCRRFRWRIALVHIRVEGAAMIPDESVPGAEFLLSAIEHFEVHGFSSRCCEPGGIKAMARWLVENGLPDHLVAHDGIENARDEGKINFPKEKPPAFISLDDRAITFSGEFPDPKKLLYFKPWNSLEVS